MMTRAFTLVETLVAIAVVSLAIVGPLHVVQGVLQSSYTARDQLIAAALAQEGVEYVRSLRDSNFIYNVHNSGTRQWLYGLDGNGGPNCYSSNCVIDVGQQQVSGQPAAVYNSSKCTNRPQLFLSANNLYNEACSGTPTKFTRVIRLTLISPTETLLTVTVTWTGHGSYSVVLKEDLRDWL
jgi:prepilin-type N-terminal cleavage/methylation domain-containing protein